MFAEIPENIASLFGSSQSLTESDNPLVQQLLGSLSPEDRAALSGQAPPEDTEPQSLVEALQQSAMAVGGRKGLTGKEFSGEIPAWAEDLAPAVLKNPDFDPYFGIVSQEGDERVYMGERKDREAAPARGPSGPAEQTPIPASADLMAHRTGHDVPATAGTDGDPDWFGKFEDADHKLDRSGSDPNWFGKFAAAAPKERHKDGPDHKKGKPSDPGLDGGDRTRTVMQAMNMPYMWSQDEIAEAMKKMRHAGFNVTSFDQGETSLLSVWGGMVQRASTMYAMSEGRRKVTPWDALDLYKSEFKASGNLTDYQNGSKTTVQRTVSDVPEGAAWSTLKTALSNMIGRDPSDEELRKFTYRMNSMAAANPSISKTITRYKNGEAVESNSTVDSGFTGDDMAQAAYERAQNEPDYAEYQAATTYFNAAQTALGAIGNTSA